LPFVARYVRPRRLRRAIRRDECRGRQRSGEPDDAERHHSQLGSPHPDIYDSSLHSDRIVFPMGETGSENHDFDYDFVVVGSGFGGSVSACRLAEKGYSVAVIEMGKRWTAADFPKSTWNLRRWIWRPRLG